MTDSDVIKALECCAHIGQCTGCGYYEVRDRCCVDAVMEDAIALIKRQQEELARMTEEKDNINRNYDECAMGAAMDLIELLKKYKTKLFL